MPPGPTTWKLPGDLGRRYAAVSGDHNPIHLYGLTAKAFGFRGRSRTGCGARPGASRRSTDGCLPRSPSRWRSKPILLPGTVAFGSHRTGEDYAFSLTSPRNGAPHLLGRASPLHTSG